MYRHGNNGNSNGNLMLGEIDMIKNLIRKSRVRTPAKTRSTSKLKRTGVIYLNNGDFKGQTVVIMSVNTLKDILKERKHLLKSITKAMNTLCVEAI